MSYERFRSTLSPWASFLLSILCKRHCFTFICSPIAVVGALVVIFASFKSASESHVYVNILCRIKRSFHRLRHVLIDSRIGLAPGACSAMIKQSAVDGIFAISEYCRAHC